MSSLLMPPPQQAALLREGDIRRALGSRVRSRRSEPFGQAQPLTVLAMDSGEHMPSSLCVSF